MSDIGIVLVIFVYIEIGFASAVIATRYIEDSLGAFFLIAWPLAWTLALLIWLSVVAENLGRRGR